MKIAFQMVADSQNSMNETKFKLRDVRTVKYGTETAFFVASRIWSSLLKRTKTVILQTDLKRFYKFCIQKITHASFAKIIYYI